MAGFRHSLQSSVAASSAPYGYTLAIWGAGASTMDVAGKPHVLQALLYMAGAVCGFLAVEIAAYGHVRVQLSEAAPTPVAIWSNAHWVSAGAGILAAWGLAHLVGGTGAWPAAGFAATVAYLLLNAAQSTTARRAAGGG